MSTVMRLTKGTGLTLGRVATAVAGQIVTVPMYLSHWDAQTYGVWLILQGMLGYLTLASVAYQQYTYSEVLKCGPEARDAVRRIYLASLAVAYVIALAEFGVILGVAPQAVSAAVELAMPSGAAATADTIILLLVLYSLLNLVMMPFGSITAQTMTIHGYYPRTAAWGLLDVAAMLFAPAVAVAFSADLLTTGMVQIAAHAASAVLSALDMMRLARRYDLLRRQRIDWRTGFANALYCLPLAGRTFIDSFRQQGFRILIGAYVGATAVTTLATTRTFANVLHQGLTTITAPLMPELMRYIVNRDQDRMEGAFAIVWLCLFALLVPGALVLCILAEPFFLFWTRGAVGFDPVLFLTLLVAVMVFATGQPAAATLQGQNRIAWMLSAAVVAAAGLAALALLLIPPFGLRGAGLALLGGEFCAVAVNVTGAVRTLRSSDLAFPLRSFALVMANVAAVFVLTLPAVTMFAGQAAVMALPFAANALFAAIYWATIPALARTRIRSVLAALRARLPGHPRAGASGSD